VQPQSPTDAQGEREQGVSGEHNLHTRIVPGLFRSKPWQQILALRTAVQQGPWAKLALGFQDSSPGLCCIQCSNSTKVLNLQFICTAQLRKQSNSQTSPGPQPFPFPLPPRAKAVFNSLKRKKKSTHLF
jgi:hypothetical protein